MAVSFWRGVSFSSAAASASSRKARRNRVVIGALVPDFHRIIQACRPCKRCFSKVLRVRRAGAETAL